MLTTKNERSVLKSMQVYWGIIIFLVHGTKKVIEYLIKSMKLKDPTKKRKNQAL